MVLIPCLHLIAIAWLFARLSLSRQWRQPCESRIKIRRLHRNNNFVNCNWTRQWQCDAWWSCFYLFWFVAFCCATISRWLSNEFDTFFCEFTSRISCAEDDVVRATTTKTISSRRVFAAKNKLFIFSTIAFTRAQKSPKKISRSWIVDETVSMKNKSKCVIDETNDGASVDQNFIVFDSSTGNQDECRLQSFRLPFSFIVYDIFRLAVVNERILTTSNM